MVDIIAPNRTNRCVTLRRVTKNGKIRWRLAYIDQGQERRKFFKSKRDAEDYWSQINAQKSAYGEAWLALVGAERAQCLEAFKRASEGGYSLMDACDVFERKGKRRLIKKPLEKVIEEFMKSKRLQNLRKRSLDGLNSTLSCFSLGRAHLPVCDIKQSQIEEYIQKRPVSIRRKIGIRTDLSTFWGYAAKRNYVASNLVKDIPKPLFDETPPGIVEVPKVIELFHLAQQQDPEFLPYFALGFFCGLRHSEICLTTWDSIDLGGGQVEVSSTRAKSRQRRLVTLSDNCKAWLKLGGKLPLNESRTKYRWNAIRDACGFGEGKWPHNGMRHSFASYHLAFHGSADKTSYELGHNNTNTLFKNYRELVKAEDGKKFWEIYPKS